MYAKKHGRVSFRSNRRQGYKRSSNYNNGKVRNKGNIVQQYQKYLKLAKEASSSGDRIQTEYYYQFADHYSRLMIELDIAIDDSDTIRDNIEIKSNETKVSSNENISNENDSKNKDDEVEIEETQEDSIESVSFISEPVKKKSSKLKKDEA